MYLSAPKGFRDPAEIRARDALAAVQVSAQPLNRYCRELHERLPDAITDDGTVLSPFVPEFDPADAGICARVLFVAESPGPKTNPANGGSGYISADNNDESAKMCWTVRDEVGLGETEAAHWNTVAWYLGTAAVKPNQRTVREGVGELRRLLPLFHRLEGIVACGGFAKKAMVRYGQRDGKEFDGLWVIGVPHPSPLAMNRPHLRAEFVEGLVEARRRLGSRVDCGEHPRV